LKKTLYLVDGHAQIFRAYYAPFHLQNAPSGEPVKATHTFTQMLLSLLRKEELTHLAVALDVSDSSARRTAIFPEYKANRDEIPEDLPPQIDRITEIVGLFGIPTFFKEGYEADDVIATIVDQLQDDDVDIMIVSRDKDLFQLLGRRVRLWDPGKDQVIDPKILEAERGFTPEQAVEIQVLSGDTVDNIPGIRGVGPKKAVQLIGKYGSADEVIAHADELTPKLKENVLAFRDQAPITRELVTLVRDVPVTFDLDACMAPKVPVDALRPVFEELGFKRLISQIEGTSEGKSNEEERSAANRKKKEPAAATPSSLGAIEILGITGESAAEGDAATETAAPANRAGYKLVDTEEAFEEFFGEIQKQETFAIDTETTSLRPVECDLVGLSFSWEAGEAFYLPLRSREGATLDPERTLERLRPILENPAIAKCGQNLKYDIQSLRTAGIELRGVGFDSMVAAYLVHPARRGYGMDALAQDLLGEKTIPISDLIGKGKKQISLLDVSTATLSTYAAEDADITWRLCEQLRGGIDDPTIKSLFYDVELPLVEVLADMEYEGVQIDRDLLGTISLDLGKRLDQLREEIYGAAGRPFTVDSPKQLAEVLFDDHGLRVVKKTKTSRSTDAEVLATLRAETAHPLPGLVLEYRELNKLRGTYVDPLPLLVSERTGRLHPSYHQTVAATGRLSSSDPNIQNIPIRTEQGRQIRRAFVARSAEHRLICADYSQIELRILAHLAADPALRTAFEEDQDVHATVAAEIAGIPLEEVTAEQRGHAKAINFGIIYGQGAFGLSKSLGITRKDAETFIASYKARYQGIVQFMAACVEEAEKTGGVSTLLGRRRPIPEIHSKNRNLRALGERLAINTVVQGTAADMIKVAMVRVHRRLAAESLSGKLLIQVHDELVVEAPRDQVEAHTKLMEEEMVAALPLDVPVKVDTGVGSDWLEAKG